MIAAITLVAIGFSQACAAGGGPSASVFEFNPPKVQQELNMQKTLRSLYRGIKETSEYDIERMGLRILLNIPTSVLASSRLRRALAETKDLSAEKVEREKERLADWLEAAKSREDFSERYLAYEGPGDREDPDFFVYTSPHKWLARVYGNVIFEIREHKPRGVDLAAHNLYEHGAARERALADFSPKKLLVRKVMDKDEYLIPSHIPHKDIQAFEVYDGLSLNFKTTSGAGNLARHLRRRYQRSRFAASSCIDVFDDCGRLIARLSRNQMAYVPKGDFEPSNHALPRHILAELNALRAEGMKLYVSLASRARVR